MREILFRGKRVDNGEWIEGDLITTPFIRNETQQNIIYILDITKVDYDCFEDLTEDNGIFEVYPETVCQYTGLTDKNGRKIFEGDIVKYENKNFAMKYIDGFSAFDLRSIDNMSIAPRITTNTALRFEVVGNIFDNPELIGEQHERNMGTLPHLPQQNPNENKRGHRGEKPHCVLPEVQEGERGGY